MKAISPAYLQRSLALTGHHRPTWQKMKTLFWSSWIYPVNPDDIDISLNNGILTIKGDRSSEQAIKENSLTRRERRHGTFLRQFNLPESVDVDTVSAKSAHGVLTVTIPKATPARPISVAVEAG